MIMNQTTEGMKSIVISLCLLTSLTGYSIEKDSAKVAEKKIKEFEKQITAYTYVPSGTFNYGSQDLSDFKNGDSVKVVSVKGFFMLKREITNFDYLEFLLDVKKKDTALYRKILPDTLVWRERLAYNEPYVDYYFRHPAYRNYPVVGISYNQAVEYCKWATTRINEHDDLAYGKILVDLPNEEEWEYAARGGFDLSPYPWGGPYLRNAKGSYLANFARYGEGGLVRDTLYTYDAENDEYVEDSNC